MQLNQILKVRTIRFLAAAAAGLALVACANQMEPAKKMLGDVEAAVTAAGADAQQYIPEQVASVNQKLGELKAAFDKQDYKTVIAGAPALLVEAKGLADAAAAKKKEVLEALGAQWTSLAAELPQSLSAVEAKLATLAKTRKLPAGVTKDGIAAAKGGVAEAKTAWDEAKAAFGAGNVQAALDKAKVVKAKLTEVAAQLGLGAAQKPAA
jgi:hypothetical protein